MTVRAWCKLYKRMTTTELLYIDLYNAAWLGMFINRPRVQPLHTDSTLLSDALATHGKHMVNHRFYHEEQTEHIFFTRQCHFSPLSTPPELFIITVIFTIIHNLCNNLFLLLFFYMFIETQRQHRSRQPTESVCVMNHGVPTTMCMTHNGPSPTW